MLRLVNNTPGDVVEPFIPGTPVVFSLKSDDGRVRCTTLQARVAFSNIVHKTVNGVSLLPELNETLLKNATVALAAPEHQSPAPLSMPRAAQGSSLVIGPGSGAVDKGIYEVATEIASYGDVLAGVALKVADTWSFAERDWCSLDGIGPVYLGFEYAVRNTGLFVFLRDDGSSGSLVAGGPQHEVGGERLAQVEISIGWKNWAPGSTFEVYFDVDSANQTMKLLLKQPGDDGPLVLHTFPLGHLGQYEAPASSFSQKRVGPSHSATLFFGNGGGVEDSIEFVDFGLFPHAPWAVVNGEQTMDHSFRRRPDLPLVYLASEKRLPDAKGLGRWLVGAGGPTTKFWYQPGRKNTPLYTVISKSPSVDGPSDAFLFRKEPHLLGREAGFSVEAWMSGNVTDLSSPNTGVGLRVDDGDKAYILVAVDTQIVSSWGLVKDLAYADEVRIGYAVPLDGAGELITSSYRSLRLVRLTCDRERGKVDVFIEDMDTPLVSVDIEDVLVPADSADGRVSVGHVAATTTDGDVHLAAVSYLNHYRAWEKESGAPNSDFVTEGSGTFEMDAKLSIEKAGFGPGATRYAFFHEPETVAFFSGFQVDFRGRVVSYTNEAGAYGAPNKWTGAGVTVFLGETESPLGDHLKLHVGFFDCGVYGKKIAVMPGRGSRGAAEIIEQTALGRLYSADADWLSMASYRLVYHAHHGIAVYGANFLKDDPIIFIPWDQYLPEVDENVVGEGIAFGAFASEVSCVSEWEYLRWGVSTGYEAEFAQKFPSNTGSIFGGKAHVFIDAEEGPFSSGNEEV